MTPMVASCDSLGVAPRVRVRPRMRLGLAFPLAVLLGAANALAQPSSGAKSAEQAPAEQLPAGEQPPLTAERTGQEAAAPPGPAVSEPAAPSPSESAPEQADPTEEASAAAAAGPAAVAPDAPRRVETPQAATPALPSPAPVPLGGPTPSPSPAWVEPSGTSAPGSEGQPELSPGWSWATPAMPGSDTVASGSAGPATYREVLGRVPWSGTSFVFNNSVTTSALGIGRDYIGRAHQAYVQQYVLLLNYYLLWLDSGINLRLQAAPSMEVELTNSDVTTYYREPLFGNLPVSLIARFPVVRAEQTPLLSGTLLTNLTTIFATSKLSQGEILTLSPRVVWAQGIPLLGEGAKWLDGIGLIGAVRYDRMFTHATVPSDRNLNRLRGVSNSTTGVADSLSGVRYAPNALTLGGFLNLEETVFGRSLSFSVGAQYGLAWLYPPSDAPVPLATGPVNVPSRGRRVRRRAGVLAGLSYVVSPELAVTLGYVSQGELHAPDYRFLYTPGAQFTATLGIALDALYELATGARREAPFFLPGARPY